ncbi:CoA-binding protein [Bacteroidetes/Chlorobi group bacterium Naka2016]|jgi:predicted CoA-binding protein|nr:MAG: CoA-binding protein [Bacteroidetes/Chlorobi group bacterium Naka2016]
MATNPKEYLKKYKNIAVYGFSKNPEKVAHTIPVYLKTRGYNVVGINPQKFEVAGIPVYQKLMDVPEEIEILDVFRPSEHCLDVAKEAIERRKVRGDIKVIWLQEGIVNDEAKKLAEENGIVFVQDTCIYQVYQSMLARGEI